MSAKSLGIPVVELKGVYVQYPNGVTAVEDVNLTVEEKDFVGLIGPNGAGKSTIIKVMLGLIKPNRGTVRLFNEPFTSDSLKDVGFIPQRAAQSIDPNFPATVYETVLLGRVAHAGLIHGFRVEDRKKVEEVMSLLEISDLRNRKIGELSGGQSQRVFLAKALVGDPRLLILDEPTSGVDVASKKEFYLTLKQLNKEMGVTIVLASHEIEVVKNLATQVLCLNKAVYFCGELELLQESSALADIFGFNHETGHSFD
jgi:zinc transport system ATP-binding protein